MRRYTGRDYHYGRRRRRVARIDGIPGVPFILGVYQSGEKYGAEISLNDDIVDLGVFDTKEQAGIAYDRAAVVLRNDEIDYPLNYPAMSDVEREEALKVGVSKAGKKEEGGETKPRSSGPSQRVINQMSFNKARSIQDFGDSPSLHQRVAMDAQYPDYRDRWELYHELDRYATTQHHPRSRRRPSNNTMLEQVIIAPRIRRGKRNARETADTKIALGKRVAIPGAEPNTKGNYRGVNIGISSIGDQIRTFAGHWSEQDHANAMDRKVIAKRKKMMEEKEEKEEAQKTQVQSEEDSEEDSEEEFRTKKNNKKKSGSSTRKRICESPQCAISGGRKTKRRRKKYRYKKKTNKRRRVRKMKTHKRRRRR